MRVHVAVFLGGALGTLARAGVAGLLPVGDGWPWATFCVNVLGAALLGAWATALHHPAAPVRSAFLTIGLLGSFTTFSTFAVEVRTLGPTGLGLLYGVVSTVAGVTAARAGQLSVRPRAGRRP